MPALARFVERLLPALLMASSVSLLSAGIFAYAPPAVHGERGGDSTASLEPGSPIETASPTPRPTATSGPRVAPTAPATVSPASPSAQPTLPAAATPQPSPEAAPATRIVVASLGIDLPVVRGDLDVPGNRNQYPLCDVAQFLVDYPSPGATGSTYIYAHARAGMFLPLLEASQRNDGAEMIGALVEVYSADLVRHVYEIFIVRRHATDLALANDVAPGEHRLVLQTSEGPRGTIPKLQVAAHPVGTFPASAAESLPEPRPRACP